MIYWQQFYYKNWQFILAATEQGLCFTGSQGKGIEELEAWVVKAFPNEKLQQDSRFLSVYAIQFQRFLDGEQKCVTCPIHYGGTAFQRLVWQSLQRIPYGQTRTYSDIAKEIGKPSAVRAVASAIGKNPIMIAIPCHRVIGKNGKLTGFRGGLQMKEKLLEIEGINCKK